MTGELLRAPNLEALYRTAAEIFAAAAADAVTVRGTFDVALSGGSTPRNLYTLLAEDPSLRVRIPWHRVNFYFGDERHVPPDHDESNFRMAQEAMFNRLPAPPGGIWRVKGEYASADEAAKEYERDLRTSMVADAGQLPRFDLVLLGMGADGHTASLFPRSAALYQRDRLVVSNRVEKLNAERITVTVPVFNNAAEVLFLIQGADKADALRAVLEGPYDPDRLPAQLIRPTRGRLRWLVDPSAARSLSAAQAVELPS